MSVRIDVTHGYGNVDIEVHGYGSTTDQIREAVEAVGRALDVPLTVVRTDG